MNTRHLFRRLSLCAAAAVLLTSAALAQIPATTPVSALAAQDIRDIRGPKPIGSEWLLPALLGLAVAAVGAGAALWARRRRQRPVEQSPREVALARLGTALALLREGNSREFSIEVSGIVREYVEAAYHIIATHQTTDEFLLHVSQAWASDPDDRGRLMAEFLRSCDLGKFGGWNLTVTEMQVMFESAQRFIADGTRRSDLNAQPALRRPLPTRETYDSLPST